MSATTPRRTRVLVFPCGAENALEIHQALRYSVNVELYGSSSVEDHGQYTFDRYTGDLPRIQEAGFDDAFAALIARHSIDVVFPTHDSVAEYLAPRAAAMRFFLVNGDPETARVTRRKSMTYSLFADRPWVPQVYLSMSDVKAWPALVKPDTGQGGQNVAVVADEFQAREALDRVSEPLLVEYLPGAELTVDCFTDRHGDVLYIGARTRERVKAGISMRSANVPNDAAIEGIAADINSRLRLRGPWFFQLKGDRAGSWKLLEISCRVAGTMVAQRARGVNLPLMAVHDYLGRDLIVLPETRVRRIDRRIATRATLDFDFDTVYVDLDDTLIIDGHAVPQVMAFLYASVRKGRRLVLITRHAADVGATLERARIAASLFDRIVHVTDGSCKSLHVTPRSIFVDNHFPERLAVARRHGVPVLDVDMLELFTD